MCSNDLDQVILATGGYDHMIKFWNILSGICTNSVQHPDSQVNALEITPDKKHLAAASFQHIRMYDIHSNSPNFTINYDGISKNVTSIGFHEDGRWMYTGGEDNIARIWDLRTHNLQCQRQYNAHSPINTVALHPNQVDLYIGDQNGTIHLWDLRSQNGELKTPFFKIQEMDVSIQHIHIDPEGSYIAAVDNQGFCYLFSIQTVGDSTQYLRHAKMQAHKRVALKCKFSPDSTLLVTTSADCTAKVWRTTDLQLLLSHKEEKVPQTAQDRNRKSMEAAPIVELKTADQRWVWDVAYSADSQYLITASSDNLARLWSITTGEMKREYNGHQKAVTALAFSDSNA